MDYSGDIPKLDSLISALDVGCSGYIPYSWEKLGSKLMYFGVDPLVTEVSRLSLKYPMYKFLDCFINCEGCKGHYDSEFIKFFNRTSAFHDMSNGFNLIKENFNHGEDILYTENVYSPRQVLNFFGITELDLLKIDVDGDDFAILKGFLDDCSISSSILAFEIESPFHGDHGEFGNTFENILRISKGRGFHLYKLDSHTYSRAARPKPYVYDFPAQTHGGQVLWGDALFIRDALEECDPVRISKLIEIYEVYDLDDCAQEARNFHKSANQMDENLPELRIADTSEPVTSISRFKSVFAKAFKF